MSCACWNVSALMTGGWVISSDQIQRPALFQRILVW